MATLTRRIGIMALAILSLLGAGAGRADAVINPLFQVPFGVNPYYRIRPALTVTQAAYNIATMGQALSYVPPYAMGYNPYMPMYMAPAAPAYAPSYGYPMMGSYSGNSGAYLPMNPAYPGMPPANPYVPQAKSEAPSHKGLDRLAGLTRADGNLDWPLGLRVLPPAAETDHLRKQIATEILGLVDRAAEGKADPAAVRQASGDIQHLKRLLNERALDVPLTEHALTEARRFLRSSTSASSKWLSKSETPITVSPDSCLPATITSPWVGLPTFASNTSLFPTRISCSARPSNSLAPRWIGLRS
jgi:hypothetical protein